MLSYTEITQNTYIQSCTVTEIMATEKCGHLAFPRTVRLQLQRIILDSAMQPPPSSHLIACKAYVGQFYGARAPPNAIRPYFIAARYTAQCRVLGTLKTTAGISARVFVVQFNGFMSLTSYFDVKDRY